MTRSLRSRRHVVGAVVLLGVLTSACVQPDPPSVGMSKVEASLVFGVTEVPQPVVTPVEQAIQASIVVPAVDAGVEEAPEEEVAAPSFDFSKPKVPVLRGGTSTATREECPTAPITAAAELAPQPRISGDPLLGISKWRLKRSVTNNSGPEPVTTTDEVAADQRVVRNFTRISDTVFTFETVAEQNPQSQIQAGFTEDRLITVTTYEVNTTPVSVNPSDGVGTVATPGVGEPERGITITKIHQIDPQSGQIEGRFEPAVGLLVLPLPVVAGETFSTSAVDARTGQTISRESTVVGKERIDACGTLVDGWTVKSKERSSFGQSITDTAAAFALLEWDVTSMFATQYGGIPILDRIDLADCETCPLSLEYRLGQLQPDPLPSS